MYSLNEENELIRRAQSGSQIACEQLYTAYAGLILNMRRRYTRTPAGQAIDADALGILHLAFIDAIHDFSPERRVNFAAFLQSRLHSTLYKAFKQACQESQRTAQLVKQTDEDQYGYFDWLESPGPSIERTIIAREELASILGQLSKQEKALLHLLYTLDLPQTHVARILHISPQALHKRKEKLMAKLKKLA